MATKLKQLKITSVDLCKQGANPEAFIKFYKSAEGEVKKELEYSTQEIKDLTEEILKSLDGENPSEEIQRVTKAFETSLLAEEEIEKAAEPKEVEDEEDLFPEEVDEDEEEIEEEEVLEKMEKGFDISKMDEADAGSLKDLMKKYGVPFAQEEKKEDEVKKSVELEEIKKEYDNTIAEVKKAKRELEVVTLTKSYEKYSEIGKDAEEVAKKFLELKDVSEEIAKEYIELLDEQVNLQKETGIFKSYGKSGSSERGWGGLEAIAKTYEEKGMTKEAAIVKAGEEHPELVADYYENEF